MISPPSPRRRRSRRTLIAASVLGFVALALVTVSPLRAYITGATTERRDETSYVIAAAGDIVCSSQMQRRAQERVKRLPTDDTGVPDTGPARTCAARETANLLRELAPAAVLPLGDLQYECGDTPEFEHSYSATWGEFKSVSRPVVGNHEYGSACGRSDASGYFDYFGQAAGEKGWYSWNLGDWHFIALNSQCHSGRGAESVGGCNVGSEQYRWLQADLAAHKNKCTLAYWHEARFTSGRHGPALQMAEIWNELVAGRVDVVLTSHNHVYERFDLIGHTEAPKDTGQDPDSIIETPNLDPNGIQQFVVGTGGRNHVRFTKPPLVGEVARDDRSFGVLSMRLYSSSYDWAFVPVEGSTFRDRGSAKCR